MRKAVPELIDRLVARVNDRSTEPVLRCALVIVPGGPALLHGQLYVPG